MSAIDDARLQDFVSVTVALGILTPEEAKDFASEARQQQAFPIQLALQKGKLNAAQLDLVESLLHPRDTIPGYEILSHIGTGGMGVVYRARQVNLDRVVALKTISVSRLGDQASVTRFEREAMSVAQLRHPNIVTAYDFGRSGGRWFLSMELVDGESVENWLSREGPMPEAAVWGLIRQAAGGLAHAQHAGIVHRDIKPANLLMAEPPEGSPLPAGIPMIKIADFGLALQSESSQRGRLTSDNIAVGSPHYMAPEQFNANQVDYRADMYSLGATAFHMLAGAPLFAEESLPKIIARKLGGESIQQFENHQNVSAAAGGLLRSLLASKPDERPTSYDALIAQIDSLPTAATDAAAIPFRSLPAAEPIRLTTREAADQVTSDGQMKTPLVEQSTIGIPIRRRHWLGWSAAAAAIAVGGAGAWWLSRPTTGKRTLVTNGQSELLFDGSTLNNWDVTRSAIGGWEVDAAPDSAEGISCISPTGAISRRLPDWQHYRLTCFLTINADVLAADVDFDFNDQQQRLSVRVEPQKVALGNKTGDFGELEPVREKSVPGLDQRPHVLHFERQSQGWWVFFEEQLLGVVPFLADKAPGELRLATQGGKMWITELISEQLGPARS